LALAKTLVGNAPLAQAAIKEVLRHTQGLAIEPGYQALRHHDLPAYRAMLHSEDATEGPRAFGEKRAPHWRGV
jgi:crotonobetainyl-CoA hydratase